MSPGQMREAIAAYYEALGVQAVGQGQMHAGYRSPGVDLAGSFHWAASTAGSGTAPSVGLSAPSADALHATARREATPPFVSLDAAIPPPAHS